MIRFIPKHARILLVGIPLTLLIGCSPGAPETASVPTSVATPTAVGIAANGQVIANGKLVPAQNAKLTFSSTASVTNLLVAEGDRVEKGAALAQVDQRELELGVAQAQAALDKAKADYNVLLDGSSPEEIASAQARVSQAQAQQRQTKGGVTQQDIVAAQEKVRQAQAQLTQLEQGAIQPELDSAQAKINRAAADLETQRNQLSAAKTDAYLAMQQAVETLTKAQSTYANAKKNWEHVDETGHDPLTSRGLNEAQKRQYRDAFTQAEADLQHAEYTVHQAQVDYDKARQAEVTGIASAEAALRDAQASLDTLKQPATNDKISAARAALAQAQADFVKLGGDQRSGTVNAAVAQVEIAQADLEKLKASPRASALAQAQAVVQQAEVSLKQAQLALDQATLNAPFAGTVAEITFQVGERPTSDSSLILADMSAWHVETDDLTEIQVVRVHKGAKAEIVLDALPEQTFSGVVSQIKAIGKNQQGDITYTVIVTPDQPQNPQFYWNMTAKVTIDSSMP